MKTFHCPVTNEQFGVTLVKGPGMGATLSFHPGKGSLSKHLFVPSERVPEARRAFNRPHMPEQLIGFAEGLRG